MLRLLIKILLAAVVAANMLMAAPSSAFASVKKTDIVADSTAAQYIAQGIALPDIQAKYAALGSEDGRLLWARGLDAKVPIASLTKIMTALVALEQVELSTKMKVTEGAASTPGSTANLKAGDWLTFEQLLYCMLLPSGNDASVCIAQNVSGIEATFTKLMNAKAIELGMNSTNFTDASGLDEKGQYSTASDLLILTRNAMRNNIFRAIVATHEYKFKCGKRTIELVSTDKLANYLADGQAIGVKTGTNTTATYCFIGAAVKDNVELYAVVLADKLDEERFADASALMRWGFAHLRTMELLTPLTKVGSVGLTSWLDKSVDVYAKEPVYVNAFDLDEAIVQQVELSNHDGGITAGDPLGRVIWMQEQEVVATVDLVADKSVPAPDILGSIAIGFQRFLGWFSGVPTHVESVVYPRSNASSTSGTAASGLGVPT